MNAQVESWLSRRKWILVALGLPILVAAWWAFRPEKLWINEKVSEPAPFASNSDPQPRYTGLLEGKAHASFTGKLISAQWDPWRDPEFRRRLIEQPDLATLRRVDEVFFAPTAQDAPA